MEVRTGTGHCCLNTTLSYYTTVSSQGCADLHRLSCLRSGVRPSPFGVDIPFLFYITFHIMKLQRLSFIINSLGLYSYQVSFYFFICFSGTITINNTMLHPPPLCCFYTTLYNSIYRSMWDYVAPIQTQYSHHKELLFLYNTGYLYRGQGRGFLRGLVSHC